MNAIQLLQHQLSYYTGTENYYRFNSIGVSLILTDGTEFIRNNELNTANWLFHAICSHQGKLRQEDFQSWTLKRRKSDWLLSVTDGNENILVKQVIGYSDFPLPEINIWVVRQGNELIAMLTSEY